MDAWYGMIAPSQHTIHSLNTGKDTFQTHKLSVYKTNRVHSRGRCSPTSERRPPTPIFTPDTMSKVIGGEVDNPNRHHWHGVLDSALDAVGHTPLIKLSRIAQEEGFKCNLCELQRRPDVPFVLMV
jgi:hypothetical protein